MKRKIGIILAAVLAVVIVAAVAGLLLVRAAEDRVTAALVARADRFAIPTQWAEESDIVRSERFLCMDTNPCPSIFRRWNAGKELTFDELKSVVSRVGFEMKTEGACRRRANDIGPTTVCGSSGTDGEYDYILNVTSPDANEPDLVALSVRPHQ